jgi:esterase/lipase superfamily enzyme
MLLSWIAGRWVRTMLLWIVAVACLASLPHVLAPAAQAQSWGERWVTLATRDIDAKAGRASIDLSNAKGAFRAIRVSLKAGALALTQVELRYDGAPVHTARRAVVLRQNERPQLIDTRSEDRFLDSLVLAFRAVPGEPDKAMLVVEGLQTLSGAAAVRGRPPPAVSQAPKSAESAKPTPAETEAKARSRDEVKPAPPPPPPPVAGARPPAVATPPPTPAAPPPIATSPTPAPGAAPPPMRNGTGSRGAVAEPWDVVPVFYGTDRNREAQAKRISYGSDRARRLELGRALVTVPKAHEVPNIERPWVYRLPFTQIVLYSEAEDPKRHFTLKEVRSLSKDEFLRLVRERLNPSSNYKDHALVFVHGFNTSFEHALYRTAQIAYDIKFDGAPFLYSWPSKGALSTQDYSYDRESSGQAEPYLRQFLEVVARETGAKSVSVIAHSMGNQLLLPVLRDLKRAAPPSVAISQVILAAPDVDRDAFENIAKELAGVSRGVTMLAAGNDRALGISRRFWGGVPRAGDVPAGGPIVIDGVDTIDVTAISTLLFALNHSGYAETSALLQDIQLLIQTGERPPDKRVPILERVKTSRGDYWRYPKPKP